MFGLSPIQLLICGVVAVLLFGKNLPSVARSLGKSFTEFRRGMQDLQHDFRDAMREAEKAAEPAQARLASAAASMHDDSADDTVYDRPPESDNQQADPADARDATNQIEENEKSAAQA